MIVYLTIADDILAAFGSLGDKIYDLACYLVALLPDSPLAFLDSYSLPVQLQQWIGNMNYFIPVAGILVIANSWLACMLIYYVVRILLKWLKAEA